MAQGAPGRAAEGQPADDGGLVPAPDAAAAALQHRAGGAGDHRRTDRAGDAAAGLRHRRADRCQWCVRAAAGGPAVVVGRPGRGGRGCGRAAGLVLVAAAVPEGPHHDVPGPGDGCAGRGLEHHPVEDRDRFRRLRRQGLGRGLAVAPELHSRADHRLRVLGAERGIRLDRRCHRAGAVPGGDRALPVDCQPVARFLFAAAGRCHRPGVLRVRAGQRRDDFRPAAGGGRADATDQLRRHLGGIAAGRLRAGDGSAQPQPGTRRLRLSPAPPPSAHDRPAVAGCAVDPDGRRPGGAAQRVRPGGRAGRALCRWPAGNVAAVAGYAAAPARVDTGVVCAVDAAADGGVRDRYRQVRAALAQPGCVLPAAVRAAQAQPAADDGLVPAPAAAATVATHGADRRGADRSSRGTDPDAAQPGHRHAGHRQRRVCVVAGRPALGLGRHWRDRAGAGRTAGVVRPAAAVPEGPRADLPRPGGGPARHRLEHPAVAHRDRFRWMAGPRLGAGHAGHAGFPARIHDRLRVFSVGRRVRLDRRGDGVCALPVRGRALPVDRGARTRHARTVAGRQPGAGVLRLCPGERWNDFRPAAGGGHTDAVDQLWRDIGGFAVGRPSWVGA
ncbi:hypothetical protein G6F57_013540 [Rhizopus arrhizus]|nr:hypothetical protein G6F57_013540 [Rhizopus arrhizus]